MIIYLIYLMNCKLIIFFFFCLFFHLFIILLQKLTLWDNKNKNKEMRKKDGIVKDILKVKN